MFSIGQSFETVIEFANTLRRYVDDCTFPVEFYQQATTFVMGIEYNNVKTEGSPESYPTDSHPPPPQAKTSSY